MPENSPAKSREMPEMGKHGHSSLWVLIMKPAGTPCMEGECECVGRGCAHLSDRQVAVSWGFWAPQPEVQCLAELLQRLAYKYFNLEIFNKNIIQ